MQLQRSISQVQLKKPDTKEYISYNPIYMKLKNSKLGQDAGLDEKSE